MITQGDGAGQGGSLLTMLATINDVRHAYTQLEVVRVHMGVWVAYFAAHSRLQFSDRLHGQDEADAVAEAERQLTAAGVTPGRVPRQRQPQDRPAPRGRGGRTGPPSP